ncbi:dihydrofolate reductase family protein [Amycolatopsis orientalis]|uniref:dihydrofolate reductase family protein n=1 Tax=Amycolatopsis orientalis TaxID=31958 RepID=UPI0013A07DCC|nr:dihydrofolate reductase family protein [Amycolatopsis orientalis]
MRKLIVTILMSLDGHYEGPGGNFMVMPLDNEFDTHNRAELAEAGTLLLGARTFQLFQGFWPRMAGDPAATEVHGRFPGATARSRRWSSPTHPPKNRTGRTATPPRSCAGPTRTSTSPN